MQFCIRAQLLMPNGSWPMLLTPKRRFRRNLKAALTANHGVRSYIPYFHESRGQVLHPIFRYRPYSGEPGS